MTLAEQSYAAMASHMTGTRLVPRSFHVSPLPLHQDWSEALSDERSSEFMSMLGRRGGPTAPSSTAFMIPFHGFRSAFDLVTLLPIVTIPTAAAKRSLAPFWSLRAHAVRMPL